MSEPHPSRRLWRYAPVAVVAAGLVGAYALGLHRYLTLDAVAALRQDAAGAIAGNLPISVAIYIGVYAAAAALSLPGAAFLTIAGGFLFGPWVGGGAALIGALVGATLVFTAARTAFGDTLRGRLGGFLQKLEAGFRKNAFNYLLTLRLVPIVPFWALNIAPAFLSVSLRDFVLASALGMIPGAFVYAAIGAGAAVALDRGEQPSLSILAEPIILAAFGGLIALSLLPILFRRASKDAT